MFAQRTRNVWPQLLSDQDPAYELIDNLACSGAQTKDVLLIRLYGEPPQIDVLRALDTIPALITITIGGNDIGFGSTLKHCFLPLHNCAKDGTLADTKSLIDNDLRDTLVRTLRRVKEAAPGAPAPRRLPVALPELFAEDRLVGPRFQIHPL